MALQEKLGSPTSPASPPMATWQHHVVSWLRAPIIDSSRLAAVNRSQEPTEVATPSRSPMEDVSEDSDREASHCRLDLQSESKSLRLRLRILES